MIDKSLFRRTEAILYEYPQLEAEIISLQLKIRNMSYNYRGCGAIGYDEKTGPTNKFNSSVENEIIDREKTLKKLYKDYGDLITLKDQIDITLEKMSDVERNITKLKYLDRNKLSWSEIANKLGFNVDYVRKEKRVDIIEKLCRTIFIDRCKQEKFKI